jgi:hypothetical protein
MDRSRAGHYAKPRLALFAEYDTMNKRTLGNCRGGKSRNPIRRLSLSRSSNASSIARKRPRRRE